MSSYYITREVELSDGELADRAAFLALAFRDNPISRFSFGDLYQDNQALWQASVENDLRKAQTLGSIYTTQSNAGEIMAIAVTFDAGHEMADLPNTAEADALLAKMPEEQKAFRNDYSAKQTAVYKATYSSDVRRDHVYLEEFAVKEGHRGEGIGSSLVKTVIEDAKAAGYRLILDTSTPINVAFYQRNGVKLNAGREMSHYKYGPLPKSFVLATD